MIVYPYKGFHGFPSKCGIDIVKHNDTFIVILTELPDNSGTSITNIIESLATMVYYQFLNGVPIEKIIWIEHYPPSRHREETFDEVTFKWNGKYFFSPRWKRISPSELTIMIGNYGYVNIANSETS